MIFWTPFEDRRPTIRFSYLEYKEERILARRRKERRLKSGSDFDFKIDAICIALSLPAHPIISNLRFSPSPHRPILLSIF